MRDGVIVAGLAAALVGGALLIGPTATPTAGPSLRVGGHGRDGLSGLAAGLRAAGVHVVERDAPTLPRPGLLVTVDPASVSHDDAASWLSSLRAGAVVLYASAAASPFTDALGVGVHGGGPVAITAAGRGVLPGLAPPAAAAAAFSLPAGARALYSAGDGAALAVVPVGRGAAWLVSDPAWLENGGIVRTGLPLALPLALGTGGVVAVDAYHQSPSGRLDAEAYLPRPLRLALLEAVVAALLGGVALARRRGPVIPDEGEEPAGLGALAVGLGGLYERGRLVSAATTPIAVAARRRLGARAGGARGDLDRLARATTAQEAVTAVGDLARTTTGSSR